MTPLNPSINIDSDFGNLGECNFAFVTSRLLTRPLKIDYQNIQESVQLLLYAATRL